MKNQATLLILIAFLLQSCSPKIKTSFASEVPQRLDNEADIFIIEVKDNLPEDSKFIGDLKVGDSGFTTDCGYTKILDEAKEVAKTSGANIIHLTQVKKPNLASTCYRIKAKLYRNTNETILADLHTQKAIENKSRLAPDANYAMVYFYRPKNHTGSLIGYKIRMDDDTIIGRVRNGEKFGYKITDFGKHEFWGKTESKATVVLDIEKGQEYFVRCGIGMGIAVGKPELEQVNNKTGISEFEAVK